MQLLEFVYSNERWVRLHEKGGKEYNVPCHHNLDQFLDEYIDAAGIADEAGGYLFRTTVRKSGVLTEKPMHQQDAYRMIQSRDFQCSKLHVIKGGPKVGSNLCGFLFGYGIRRILFTGLKDVFQSAAIFRCASVSKEFDRQRRKGQQEG